MDIKTPSAANMVNDMMEPALNADIHLPTDNGHTDTGDGTGLSIEKDDVVLGLSGERINTSEDECLPMSKRSKMLAVGVNVHREGNKAEARLDMLDQLNNYVRSILQRSMLNSGINS